MQGKVWGRPADRGLSGKVCPVVDKSDVDPYGVDPVFISTSRLYDPEAKNKMCCRPESDAQGGSNASDPGFKFYKNSELNVRGVPYGFYPTLEGREAGFAVVIDINLRENAFNKLIEYLEDGFFIDKYTKNLKVEVLTYNGELRYFCNLVVDFDFSQGGNIQVEYSADSAATQPYYHDPDDETEVNNYNLRCLLEAVFCLFVLSAMFTELTELIDTTLWRPSHGLLRQRVELHRGVVHLVARVLRGHVAVAGCGDESLRHGTSLQRLPQHPTREEREALGAQRRWKPTREVRWTCWASSTP